MQPSPHGMRLPRYVRVQSTFLHLAIVMQRKAATDNNKQSVQGWSRFCAAVRDQRSTELLSLRAPPLNHLHSSLSSRVAKCARIQWLGCPRFKLPGESTDSRADFTKTYTHNVHARSCMLSALRLTPHSLPLSTLPALPPAAVQRGSEPRAEQRQQHAGRQLRSLNRSLWPRTMRLHKHYEASIYKTNTRGGIGSAAKSVLIRSNFKILASAATAAGGAGFRSLLPSHPQTSHPRACTPSTLQASAAVEA